MSALNPFTAAGARIFASISAALLLVCLALLFWGRAGYAAADRWETKSVAERDNHRITKANVRAAQEQSALAARAARLAHEATSRHLAERADHAEDNLAAARAAAARFADARRVPVGTGSPVGSSSGRSGTAGQADPAPRGDGTGADAVVLDRGEFDQLVGNTLRLEQVRRWGQSLIESGLAVTAAPDH